MLKDSSFDLEMKNTRIKLIFKFNGFIFKYYADKAERGENY